MNDSGKDYGLYGPGSTAWKIGREVAVLLGGSRAVLMQLAHPLVAMGVYTHSSYMSDPFGRAERTLMHGEYLTFGSRYDARNPELLLWVHATLVDTLLVCYQLFLGPLSYEEQDDYYQHSKG